MAGSGCADPQSPLLNLTLGRWGHAVGCSMQSYLPTGILFGEKAMLSFTGLIGKLLPTHLPFSFLYQQKSLQKLSADSLLFGRSYSQRWMHRKKPVGLPRCHGAESQSSTCPTRSVSSIGISKTWNWPSASSTSASSYCRTIRYSQREALWESSVSPRLCACVAFSCLIQANFAHHFSLRDPGLN